MFVMDLMDSSTLHGVDVALLGEGEVEGPGAGQRGTPAVGFGLFICSERTN